MIYSPVAMASLYVAVHTLTLDKRNQTTGAPHYLNAAMAAFVVAFNHVTPTGVRTDIPFFTSRVPLRRD